MRKLQLITALTLLVFLLVRCSKTDTPPALEALPLSVPAPPDNPSSPEKVALGKLLFWDPVLSINRDVACASCHHPAFGYSDGLDLSIGVNGEGLGPARRFRVPNIIPPARRNAQSIVNTAFNGITIGGACDPSTAAMFFDNRVRSLETQSLQPIKTLEEMRGTAVPEAAVLDTVLERLRSIPEYSRLFAAAFAGATASISNMSRALAAYERSLVANHSPFDDNIRGNTGAMNATQVAGMSVFVQSGCNNCHSGPMFSDYSVHVLSVPDNPKRPTDPGSGNYAFRTPTLRNLALTAPYMHSGVFTTLQQVLDFYEDIGAHRPQNPHVAAGQIDGNVRRINDRDKAALIAFLGALNDASFDKTIPFAVPSGLHPGGSL